MISGERYNAHIRRPKAHSDSPSLQLVGSAVLVTALTYIFLDKDSHADFETGVSF